MVGHQGVLSSANPGHTFRHHQRLVCAIGNGVCVRVRASCIYAPGLFPLFGSLLASSRQTPCGNGRCAVRSRAEMDDRHHVLISIPVKASLMPTMTGSPRCQ
mmetsp:Transcript_17486/g.39904  ORF Transcript_17486/g.39904 Transcript_17486/m.39904 type:complete len:102 (-) Transcript_17486:1651-1956(-)